MSTFIVTLIAIVAIVAIMAIGVIFGRKPITGSCGGLALLGLKCDCENPCPKKRARVRERQGSVRKCGVPSDWQPPSYGERKKCAAAERFKGDSGYAGADAAPVRAACWTDDATFTEGALTPPSEMR